MERSFKKGSTTSRDLRAVIFDLSRLFDKNVGGQMAKVTEIGRV